jgi:hypothetical protein
MRVSMHHAKSMPRVQVGPQVQPRDGHHHRDDVCIWAEAVQRQVTTSCKKNVNETYDMALTGQHRTSSAQRSPECESLQDHLLWSFMLLDVLHDTASVGRRTWCSVNGTFRFIVRRRFTVKCLTFAARDIRNPPAVPWWSSYLLPRSGLLKRA